MVVSNVQQITRFYSSVCIHDRGLEEYANRFVLAGWDSIDSIKLMTADDCAEVGIEKSGHQRRLLSEVEQLKKTNQCSSHTQSQTQVVPQRNTSTIKSTSDGYKKLSIWFKNPKYPRLKYSNNMLLDIYAAAFGIKGGFEQYFRQEVNSRSEVETKGRT